MKILICGGRDFSDRDWMQTVIAFTVPSCIITGMAKGADRLAYDLAKELNIPVECYPADWDTYGKSAGYRRNEQMLKEGRPNKVIAFPGGRGTAHMIKIAKEAGIRTVVLTK